MVVYDQIMRWDNGFEEIKPQQREQLSLPDLIDKELLLKIYGNDFGGRLWLEALRQDALNDNELRQSLPLGFLAMFEGMKQAYTKNPFVEDLINVYQIGDVGKIRNCDGPKLNLSDQQAYIFVPKLINSDGDGLPVIVGTQFLIMS